MNNLPKVVTQQSRGRASNPRLLDRKSDALPLNHRATLKSMLSTRIARATSGDTIIYTLFRIEVRLHKVFLQGGVLSALMWILVADGLLRALNSAAYFAQGYADNFSILVEGMDLATVCGVMQAALLRVENGVKIMDCQ